VKAKYQALADHAREDLRHGLSDTGTPEMESGGGAYDHKGRPRKPGTGGARRADRTEAAGGGPGQR
jgi:hypothetical protein